jgi:3alpha(or 20beta)-hydroxysteroid dehydrogenase
MGRLDGKVALITGAARGQGEAEARLFASEGARVVLTDVLDDIGGAVAADINATYAHLDVRDEAAWQSVCAQAVAAHGQIDILVNNAGVFHSASLIDTTIEEYERVIAINQTGVFLGMKTVAGAMKQAGNAGSIVNISSVAGLQGTPNCSAYCASKWAVRGMTKVAARELGKFNIRVNSVHPGLIDTDMMQELPYIQAGKLDRAVKNIPLRRTASANEVANVVLFLASDESAYCTGGEFTVDGGVNC